MKQKALNKLYGDIVANAGDEECDRQWSKAIRKIGGRTISWDWKEGCCEDLVKELQRHATVLVDPMWEGFDKYSYVVLPKMANPTKLASTKIR
jgi:hypothetical protein